jgi:hypothetical protein
MPFDGTPMANAPKRLYALGSDLLHFGTTPTPPAYTAPSTYSGVAFEPRPRSCVPRRQFRPNGDRQPGRHGSCKTSLTRT